MRAATWRRRSRPASVHRLVLREIRGIKLPRFPISPFKGGRRPPINLQNVDLPLPLAPNSAMRSSGKIVGSSARGRWSAYPAATASWR